MKISMYACAGCDAVTTRASSLQRFRSDRWCGSCAKKARAGEPTPRDVARANGEDARGGLTKMLDAWADRLAAPSGTMAGDGQ